MGFFGEIYNNMPQSGTEASTRPRRFNCCSPRWE